MKMKKKELTMERINTEFEKSFGDIPISRTLLLFTGIAMIIDFSSMLHSFGSILEFSPLLVFITTFSVTGTMDASPNILGRLIKKQNKTLGDFIMMAFLTALFLACAFFNYAVKKASMAAMFWDTTNVPRDDYGQIIGKYVPEAGQTEAMIVISLIPVFTSILILIAGLVQNDSKLEEQRRTRVLGLIDQAIKEREAGYKDLMGASDGSEVLEEISACFDKAEMVLEASMNQILLEADHKIAALSDNPDDPVRVLQKPRGHSSYVSLKEAMARRKIRGPEEGRSRKPADSSAGTDRAASCRASEHWEEETSEEKEEGFSGETGSVPGELY